MAERKSDFYLAPEDHNGATIRVIGVGGGGCNAVDRMIEGQVSGIEFIAVNTDHQVIERSLANHTLQIGEKVTRGLGAGADPAKGEMAANESRDEIARLIQGSDMLFITAGMGGGTGTGAAPVIAQIAREMGILTVGVVTKPFGFEGAARMSNAEAGIAQLQNYVDSLIIVPNDKLLDIADDDMSVNDAFTFADKILKYGVAGISDLVVVPGQINLDMADVRRVMVNAGICHMGIGRASGENRANVAIDEALHSPLLDSSIDGATRVIINYTGNKMKLREISTATTLVKDTVHPSADIIWGTVEDPDMGDEIMITIIASGFERAPLKGGRGQAPQVPQPRFGQPEAQSATRSGQMPSFLRMQPAAAPAAPQPQTQAVNPPQQPPVTQHTAPVPPVPAPSRGHYTQLAPEPTAQSQRTQPGQAPWMNQPAQTAAPAQPETGRRTSSLRSWLFSEPEDQE